jgi:hypothetical protein
MFPLSHTAALPGNYNEVSERGIYKRETTISNERPVSRPLKGYFRPHVAEGVPRRQYQIDPSYGAGIGAIPSNTPRIILYGATMDGSTATQGIDVNIEITFYAKFFDRRLPGQS